MVTKEREACHDLDDLNLLQRIATRDHQAFERLYQLYGPRLTRYLQRILGSHELVEDIRHDVLLVVWNQAGQYKATGRVSTWLFGIARHKAIKARARETRCSPSPSPAVNPEDETNPEHRVTQQERAHLVRRAVDTLPPSQREVLVLTYEHDYTAQAIATRQDCSVATVRYRLQQARRRLATTLVTNHA